MKKIYLIRHGFTPGNNASYNNQKGLWKIAEDKDMPLEKEYGEKQALEVGEFLSDLKGRILILVSPYLRARQTLDLALTKMKGDYEIKVVNELKEFNSGICYAKTKEEVLQLYPESKKFYEDLEKDFYNTVYPNGESRNELKARAKKIALRIKNLDYDYILIFGHGMINENIYYYLTEETLDHHMKNGEIVSVYDKRSIFVPKAYAPEGYMIDTVLYKKG